MSFYRRLDFPNGHKNSDDGNQSHTKCYLQGNVADGFPKTETSIPQNKKIGKNHCRKS